MSGTIGAHTFAYLKGNVPAITGAVEVIETPGEDGYIRRRIGLRTPPFQLQSGGHYATKTAARNAFQIFADMYDDVGSPYTLIKDGVNYTTGPTTKYRVNVLQVELLSLEQKACIAGTSDRWWMVVSWTLLLVPA